MLTETAVERSFRRLLRGPDVTLETIHKAETLLDQLRPESPLRHRLNAELEELRELSPSEK